MIVQCPCGSGSGLDRCCGPFISGEALAPTAEALMRSRFTAFAQENWDHIKRTYASEARDRFDEPMAGAPASSVIDPTTPLKAGRNDPCPCGSGMKFKKCCGR